MPITRGQFLNLATKDGDEEEMDDTDEVNISSSALDTSYVRETTVKVRDIETRRQLNNIRGTFPCVDTLLGILVTPSLKPCGYWVVYSNLQRFQELLVPLLIDEDHLQFSHFMTFIREKCRRHRKTLKHFGSLLADYRTSVHTEDPVFLKRVFLYMCRSEPCRYLMASVEFPKLMKYLPHLLPKHTDTILSSFYLRECGSADLEKVGLESWRRQERFIKHVEKLAMKRSVNLAKMERILVENPWKYGFASEMYKEMRIACMEATLQSMVACEFWDSIPSDIKNALYVYHAMNEVTLRFGHTYMLKENILLGGSSYVSVNKVKYEVTEFRNAINFLKRENIIHVSEKNFQERYHLMYLWKFEQNVAQDLATLLSKDMELLVDLEDEEFQKFYSDKDQIKAAKVLMSNSLAIITGKGGCGKTELVTALMKKHQEETVKLNKSSMSASNDDSHDADDVQTLKKEPGEVEKNNSEIKEVHSKNSCCSSTNGFQEANLGKDKDVAETDNPAAKGSSSHTKQVKDISEILFAAPTGKAASLLKKRSRMEAYTLHHIIMSYNTWKNNKESEWKYGKVRILVIDETSMVSLALFAKVLRALTEDAKLCKVILLGDLNQLPSIAPGNILKDLHKVMNPKGFCVELRTNHRSEGALIVENATRIAAQQMPIIDPIRGFYLILASDLKPPSFSGTSHTSLSSEGYNTFPSREEVNNLFKTKRPEFGFFQARDMQTSSQFISFIRNSCYRINEVAVKFYNGHELKRINRDSNKLVQDFQIGDKIMCCRNKDVRLYDENGNAKGLSRFMNGSMYMVTDEKEMIHDNTRISFLTLDNMSGEEINADLGDLKKATKIKHAWALTIHKFQGSECDTVVYIMSGNRYENWQHVYTAVTRGKKRVFIIAQKEYWLSDAVKRKPGIRQTSQPEHFHNLPHSRAFPESGFLKVNEEKEKGAISIKPMLESTPVMITPRKHKIIQDFFNGENGDMSQFLTYRSEATQSPVITPEKSSAVREEIPSPQNVIQEDGEVESSSCVTKRRSTTTSTPLSTKSKRSLMFPNLEGMGYECNSDEYEDFSDMDSMIDSFTLS